MIESGVNKCLSILDGDCGMVELGGIDGEGRRR
jgi:hypothetical protein